MQVLKQLNCEFVEVLTHDYFAENGKKGLWDVQAQKIAVESCENLLKGELWKHCVKGQQRGFLALGIH